MCVAKRISWLMVACALLFVFVGSVYAGTTGKISGVIKNAKTGEPLPSATISLDGTTIGGQTNAKGEFVILNIPPRTYTAKVRLVGFKTTIFPDIRIETDKTFTLDANIEEVILEDSTQIVQGKRDEIKLDEVQNIKTMTSDEIKSMPVSNIDDIVAVQVGVVTRGGDIHIRGGRAGEVSYIVDGVDTRDPLGGLGATDIGINLTSTALEEVQIIKSGFDAEYGNSMSGIIRIATREGNMDLTSGRFEYWTDNFRAPELNKYSFDFDRISFTLGGPEPFLSQKLLPAMGIDYFKDKLAYFVSVDASKWNTYLDLNKFAPAFERRSYKSHDFLGLQLHDRQYNNYQLQTKLTFNPGKGIKMIFNYSGQWDVYNPFDGYAWAYRYTPASIANVKETSNLFSLTFNHQLNQSTFYEVVLSRYEKEYFQVPGDPNNPGQGVYPNEFLTYDQWEYYVDNDGDGRYTPPEPFINVTGDTVYYWGTPGYTQGDAMGRAAIIPGISYDMNTYWGSMTDQFYKRFRNTPWYQVQGVFDTIYWDWDHDGYIDNADGEPFVDLNGDGRWNAGDLLIYDTNGNGTYDPERAQNINVDAPEPYTDGDVSLGEPFIDVNQNGIYDRGIDIFTMSSDPSVNMDLNRNSQYDGPDASWTPGIPYKDLNGNGIFDSPNGRYDYGEPLTDLNHNGKWDARDGFYDYGYDQWAFYHDRRAITNTVDFKFTKQVFTELENKTGFQLKYNELHMADLRYPWQPYDGIPDGGPYPDRGVFRDFYDQYPYQGAFFTQFKLEFGSLIARLGGRLDYFFQSPSVNQLVDEDIAGKQKVGHHTKISPRVGVSYPITEKAKVYFNYGHFYQLPEFSYMYQRATQASNAFGIVGNFNLDYQKNAQYEFGVKYTLSNDYVLDVAGFYNDWFGLINSQRKSYGPFQRNEYENSDYARTRGLEFELRKLYGNNISGGVSYTYSFAYGKSSSESSNYFNDFYNRAIPIQEFPLNWDVRHQLSLNFSLSISKSEKPVLFGFRIPNDWGLSVIWQYGTGYPFTPTREYPGLRLMPGEQPQSNSLRYPPNTNVDIRFHKNFSLVGLDYSFELWINNLFNTQNISFVYSATGRPDTGTNIAGQVKEGTDNANDPSNYGAGRNIRIGLALNF